MYDDMAQFKDTYCVWQDGRLKQAHGKVECVIYY
jgi:hypothetical protein